MVHNEICYGFWYFQNGNGWHKSDLILDIALLFSGADSEGVQLNPALTQNFSVMGNFG